MARRASCASEAWGPIDKPIATGTVYRLQYQLVQALQHVSTLVRILEKIGIDIQEDGFLAQVVADEVGDPAGRGLCRLPPRCRPRWRGSRCRPGPN